jgi:hypothetical protein
MLRDRDEVGALATSWAVSLRSEAGLKALVPLLAPGVSRQLLALLDFIGSFR